MMSYSMTQQYNKLMMRYSMTQQYNIANDELFNDTTIQHS